MQSESRTIFQIGVFISQPNTADEENPIHPYTSESQNEGFCIGYGRLYPPSVLELRHFCAPVQGDRTPPSFGLAPRIVPIKPPLTARKLFSVDSLSGREQKETVDLASLVLAAGLQDPSSDKHAATD